MDLDDVSIRVLRVLEDHPKLDTLQISAHAMIAPSVAREAIQRLVSRRLLQDTLGVYSLNRDCLRELLVSA